MYTIKLSRVAADYIQALDSHSRTQVIEKIELLRHEPLKLGKQLKGSLQGYRSVRSEGQRYRIIYQVRETRVEVLVVAVGLRREGGGQEAGCLSAAPKIFEVGADRMSYSPRWSCFASSHNWSIV